MSQGIKFYNKVETCVDDSLSGFVNLYPGLKLFPAYRFITKTNNHISSNVGILSGGGSGHEPFCTGYVGNGMLAGAVAGSVFASPPKSHILQAITHLHKYYKGGVLVIIPNYTGDCLNFGMAIEHARNSKFNVESFIVGEDFASGQRSIAGKRGMCGLLYTYKIGGAMASRGKSLSEIINMLTEVHKNMSTLGISAKSCSLPGKGPLFQMENDEMELGTGVHGEAGIEKVKISSAKDAVEIILSKLSVQLNLTESKENVVVFINNLGTTTELEQNIICHEIFKQLSETGIIVKRAYSGMLMTSLDMVGFQISILKLSNKFENEWLDLLDESTEAPRWVGNKMSIFKSSQAENFPEIELYEPLESKYILSSSQKSLLIKSLELVADSLVKNEGRLNELDSGCGDGDCGTTLKHLALGIQQLLLTGNLKCPANLLNQLSGIAEEKMGGTSGAIYSLFFSSTAKYFREADENFLPIVWANALKVGLKTIMKYSQARKGDRTIIDALQPAIDTYYETIVNEKQEIKYALEKARISAEIGCIETKSMKARAGRASYVSEERLKDVDAGAYGFLVCIRAISECFL